MRIILCGYGGHMGREVRTCAERAEGCEIVAGVDPMVAPQDVCVSAFQRIYGVFQKPVNLQKKSPFGIILYLIDFNHLIFDN